jgi:ABC-type polysaccharide/polyol phosphate export permease
MRYKRSILGIAWTMLNPLGMMVVLTLVFSLIFPSIENYPTYILSGLIAWTFFSQATSSALAQNIWGGALLQRIYLPRMIFTISAIATGLANLILSIVPLLIIMLVTGSPIRITILFLPIAMILLAAFSLGIGLLFSTISVFFPDFVEMYQVALIAWMYLTPIIYPAEILPLSYRLWLTKLNPMYYLVQIFRMPVYDGQLPPRDIFIIGAVLALATLFAGWLVFSRKADEFTYRT